MENKVISKAISLEGKCTFGYSYLNVQIMIVLNSIK